MRTPGLKPDWIYQRSFQSVWFLAHSTACCTYVSSLVALNIPYPGKQWAIRAPAYPPQSSLCMLHTLAAHTRCSILLSDRYQAALTQRWYMSRRNFPQSLIFSNCCKFEKVNLWACMSYVNPYVIKMARKPTQMYGSAIGYRNWEVLGWQVVDVGSIWRQLCRTVSFALYDAAWQV